MRLVIQRVAKASVEIDQKIVGEIQTGLMILIGIEDADTTEDADWLLNKVIGMRVFSDDEGKMNRSIQEVNGKILLVSQFTLHASTKKGNRPSFIKAARPEKAIPLYEYFISETRKRGIEIATGIFGGDMKVALTNDGPVTILIDSKDRE